jgi:hypothetical protein
MDTDVLWTTAKRLLIIGLIAVASAVAVDYAESRYLDGLAEGWSRRQAEIELDQADDE